MKWRLGNLDDGPNKQVFLPQVNTPSSDIHSTDTIVYNRIPIIDYKIIIPRGQSTEHAQCTL